MKQPSIFFVLNYIAIASASSGMITPALSVIQKSYGLSHTGTVWIVNIFLVGYMLGQLVYGPLANRFGRLHALRSGLIINLFGLALSLLAVLGHSYVGLLVSRLITAFGASAGLVCTYILVNELYDHITARRAFAYATVAFTVMIAASISIGGFITQYLGWPYCFALLALHGGVLLCLTWRLPETQKERKLEALQLKPLWNNYVKGFQCFPLVAFSCVMSLTGVLGYVYTAAAPLISTEILKLTPGQYGIWNILNASGMLIGGLLSAQLVKKFSAHSVIRVSLSLILLTLIGLVATLMSQLKLPAGFFVLCAFMSAGISLSYANASHLASTAFGDRAMASSAMNFLNLVTIVLGVGVFSVLPFGPFVNFVVTASLFWTWSAFMMWRGTRAVKNA